MIFHDKYLWYKNKASLCTKKGEIMSKFILAQVSFCGLNFEENFNKAQKIIKNYQNKNFDLIIFPEMFLTGYPIGNVLEKFPNIIDEQQKLLEKLAQDTEKTSVLIGFAEKETLESENIIYNSIERVHEK